MGSGKLLRIEAPHFVAGMIWQKSAMGWHCSQCAPILAYMKPWPPARVKAYIERKGWRHAWI